MMDAVTVVGLLAEEDRLKVFAALVLGARTLDEAAASAGLDVRRAASAMERLAGAGLVVSDGTGKGLRVEAEALKATAQEEGRRRAAEAEHDESFAGVAPEAAAVLRNFVTEGRLRQIPANHSKRRVVLDWLAGRFDPGRVYPERDVNLVLGQVHADVAALRRYLVDEEFLERREGFYWRAGGTFDVVPPTS